MRKAFLWVELLTFSFAAACVAKELFMESSHVNPDAIPIGNDPEILENDPAENEAVAPAQPNSENAGDIENEGDAGE